MKYKFNLSKTIFRHITGIYAIVAVLISAALLQTPQAQGQYHFKLYDIVPGDIVPGDIVTGDIVMLFHHGEVLTKLSNIVYCKNIGGL